MLKLFDDAAAVELELEDFVTAAEKVVEALEVVVNRPVAEYIQEVERLQPEQDKAVVWRPCETAELANHFRLVVVAAAAVEVVVVVDCRLQFFLVIDHHH